MNDPYIDQRANVLKNKLGVKDKEKLATLEYEFSTFRALELSEKSIRGNFDLEHLKAIHKHLF
jgi:cell filamentation protein